MIGSLRHRVKFQQLQKLPDGQGGFTHSWVDYATVWARVKAVTGKETIEADRLVSIADFKVTVRYRNDIDDTMRVVWNSKNYQILSVQPDEKEKYMTLLIREAHDGGIH